MNKQIQRQTWPFRVSTPSHTQDFSHATPGYAPPVAPSNSFWSLDYYKRYFDVDTAEVYPKTLTNQVIERMSAIFTRKDFVALVAANPDLYGPFWIPTTVIFALFASKNVTQYVLSVLNGSLYEYKMSDLSWAFSSVYGFVTFIPALLFGVVSFYKLPMTLLELLDIYGYGMVVWIPVALLCIVPSEILRWILVSLAFALSVYFQVKNVQPITKQAHNTRALLIMASIILVAQAGLAILFKIIFFKEVSSVWATPSPTPSLSPKS